MSGRQEDLLRFHIQEPQSHGTLPHNAFEMTQAATAAVALLRVKRYHQVAEFSHSAGQRIPAETDAVAQIPDADQRLEPLAGSGDADRQGIGIIERNYRN